MAVRVSKQTLVRVLIFNTRIFGVDNNISLTSLQIAATLKKRGTKLYEKHTHIEGRIL